LPTAENRLAAMLLVSALAWVALDAPARAAPLHTVYLMNDNHTDYGWNATVETYEASMLTELDYYLDQIDATAGDPPSEEVRFNADCWWYAYLYERDRSPAQFARLLDAMRSGHVTVPLNPFVELYGALPTEAVIRAGYYPGRLERRYGISFPLAQNIENATIPWGIASLWAGSGVRYSWKGICECAHRAPYLDRQTEVFRWQGPDGQELLMKWYQASESVFGRSWGGYAEARQNLSPARIQTAIDRFSARPPFLPFTGLFGGGWDDVTYTTAAFRALAAGWNAVHGDDGVVVSNGIDYFERLENYREALPVLRGGWGNDWDMWPAALAARTAQTRRAVEQLRTAEALAAAVHRFDPMFWPPYQTALEQAWNDYFKYFEHTWGSGGVSLATIVGLKKTWADHFDDVVQQTASGAAARFAALLTTPAGEQRFAVFNPLGFARTDYADLPIAEGSGPFVVTDLATGGEAASQIVTLDGADYLRILARDVPSVGYRTYRYAPGVPGDTACCTVQPETARIENGSYRVGLGERGEISSALDLRSGRELTGTGLNDFGAGSAGAAVIENAGPVSATLRVDVGGSPPRRVRVTLLRDVERIEIDDEILANHTALAFFRFDFAFADPVVHFEEVGAIARPGLVGEGGDFLSGTRARYMTLNHFVDVAADDYHVTVSNWDAYAMQIGASSDQAFDLTGTIGVLATGNPNNAGITDQGGDSVFRYRFALRGADGAFSAAEAMRASLAHQNPLRAIPLAAANDGPLTASTASFLQIDPAPILLTALKPAEEGNRGIIIRLWELSGIATAAQIDARSFAPASVHAASHIETDLAPLPLDDGRAAVGLAANQLATVRVALLPEVPTATVPAPSSTPTALPMSTVTATFSPSRTPSPPATFTATWTATRSASVSVSATPSSTPTAPGTASARATATSTANLSPPASTSRTQTPAATATPIAGDLDGDGSVTRGDLAALIAALFDPDPPAAADVSGDGRDTSADLVALLRRISPP
jgi:alpha-mannosidase